MRLRLTIREDQETARNRKRVRVRRKDAWLSSAMPSYCYEESYVAGFWNHIEYTIQFSL
jgi:hypothetical protein